MEPTRKHASEHTLNYMHPKKRFKASRSLDHQETPSTSSSTIDFNALPAINRVSVGINTEERPISLLHQAIHQETEKLRAILTKCNEHAEKLQSDNHELGSAIGNVVEKAGIATMKLAELQTSVKEWIIAAGDLQESCHKCASMIEMPQKQEVIEIPHNTDKAATPENIMASEEPLVSPKSTEAPVVSSAQTE